MTASLALHCSRCGIAANCSCGQPYRHMPARKAAELALIAHPTWSDRKIAKAVGVSQPTVSSVRSTTDRHLSVGRTATIGLDGRTRRRRRRNQPRAVTTTADTTSSWDSACDETDFPQVESGDPVEQAIFNFRYLAAMAHDDVGRATAEIESLPRAHITRKLINAAREVASAWTAFADDLERRRQNGNGRIIDGENPRAVLS
jgi:prophage DNA circulation protein